MKACIVAVGSEMLTPFRVDTNSLVVTDQLNAIGFDVRLKVVVGDDIRELAVVVASALTWADAVVIIGGLGPTDDDVTRQALADVLQVPLDLHEPTIERLEQRAARRGISMPAINRRMALVPRGAVLIDNPNGAAPGLWIESGAKIAVLLPGPPREIHPMFQTLVLPRLEARTGGRRLHRRVLKITGRAESQVDEIAEPVYSPLRQQPVAIETTILATPGQIELHLSAAGSDLPAVD